MKNTAEQLRIDIAVSAGVSGNKLADDSDDLKIEKSKIIDTSSSANLFGSESTGDVLKMEGWAYEENNRIFVITEVDSDGEWVKVDKEIKDDDSNGITIYDDYEALTVSGITVDDVVVDAVNFSGGATSPVALVGRDYMDVTADDTVTSFYEATTGDALLLMWANLSEG